MEPMPILPPPQSVERTPERSNSLDGASKPVEQAANVGGESQPGGGAPALTPVPTNLGQPDPQSVSTNDQGSQAAASTNNPTVADDVDVIEKEWIDRAKKVVNETKNDPHLQEKEVSRMQADYLMKRYGKKLRLTE